MITCQRQRFSHLAIWDDILHICFPSRRLERERNMPMSSLAKITISESASWAEDHRIVGGEDQGSISTIAFGFEMGQFRSRHVGRVFRNGHCYTSAPST